MVHLWRGTHHKELPKLLKKYWEAGELLILVPPYHRDFQFLQIFSEYELHGDWPEDLKKAAQQNPRELKSSEKSILEKAVLGVFTSGTTSGVNRLVFYSQENVVSSLNAIRELYNVNRIQKIFSYPQPTHTFGLVLGYMQAVLHNVEIIFAEGGYSRATHESWMECVDANTLTLGTPTHFIDLIQFIKKQSLTPKASYTSIVGGAMATKELWEQMRSILKIEQPSVGYGATEASPGVTHLPPGIPPQEDGDIGYALSGVKVKVQEDGVYFEGSNACAGIFENGELKHSEKILLKDSLKQEVAHGKVRFTFTGRTDLVVNRGGLKLAMEVLEGKISSHFSCKCMAVNLYDERLGEDIGFIVQMSPVDSEKVKAEISELVFKAVGIKPSSQNIVFADIPLNSNFKFDRVEGIKEVLRHRKWGATMPVEYMKYLLPHKGGAVWIDHVSDFKKGQGVGTVTLKSHGRYLSGGKVRESSCIEWIAQTYGFSVLANDILGIEPAYRGKVTFIAEVKNAQFDFADSDHNLGESLRIETTCTHDFGPLKVVQGKVFNGKKLLAQVGLKLYCGQ
ncbi:acyl--CoA ligase [Bdellovibrio sp. SKB1291214]|uniref:class I adenylate-forming enzyme family protein n=1 Tax=Bdellovibrio sp. SKB1291214 TaxID=1732569 RepID=UPI000B51AE50|nr:class I adenylate-forming enzyme family protein [Bdellovibrio sp. SKB1291214]UYL09616.1 acyl--CoA ligase [Bdellovibrio sp. SKB1291214]